MKYSDFESVMSSARMGRYLAACNNNSRKTMTLYRLNIRLSQQLFTIIGCFEVALRNAIDSYCLNFFGNDWLRNSAMTGGRFDNHNCNYTKRIINEAIADLGLYSHQKLVPELGFGFWRHIFAPHQYLATGRILLRIFPSKPTSTLTIQYNQTYIFNVLKDINDIRNRIAHHEPICFGVGNSIDTTYAREQYGLILQLFQWMNIDAGELLYGLDCLSSICSKIDGL